MDNFLKHFGIFDFLAIWGAGIVSILYYITTFIIVFNSYRNDAFDIIKDGGSFAIFVLSIIGYLIGVILHEIGKGFFDQIIKPMNIKTIISYHDYLEKSKNCFISLIKVKNRMAINILKNINHFINDIDYDNIKKLKEEFNVYDALYQLRKNKINTESIEKTQAIYAFSRSVLISLIIHFVIVTIYTFSHFKLTLLIIVLFDILIIFLFFVRSNRYYYSWIRKTFNSYCINKGKNHD